MKHLQAGDIIYVDRSMTIDEVRKLLGPHLRMHEQTIVKGGRYVHQKFFTRAET